MIMRTAAALLLSGATAPLRADVFSVAELTDLRGNKSFLVCTEQDKLKTDADLAAEAKAFPTALAATKAEWQRDHAEQAFPNNRLKPRALRVLTTTISREEADKLLAQDKGREARTLANEKKEKERVLEARPAHAWRGGGNQAAIEQQKREIRENRERDAIANKAETILRQKLAAAVGHDIPFYGAASDESGKPPKRKK